MNIEEYKARHAEIKALHDAEMERLNALIKAEKSRFEEEHKKIIIDCAKQMQVESGLKDSDCNYPHHGTLGSKKIRISAKNPWLPWFGGECPVPPNCVVEVLKRCEKKGEESRDKAEKFIWEHCNIFDACDVIAYRLLESPWQTIDEVCDE